MESFLGFLVGALDTCGAPVLPRISPQKGIYLTNTQRVILGAFPSENAGTNL